jgi:hypothetical protein
VVSSTPRPHFTPGKDPVLIVQEAGWTPGPVWTGGKSRPHRDSIPERPAHSSVAIPTELPGPHKTYCTQFCYKILITGISILHSNSYILLCQIFNENNYKDHNMVTRRPVRYASVSRRGSRTRSISAWQHNTLCAGVSAPDAHTRRVSRTLRN